MFKYNSAQLYVDFIINLEKDIFKASVRITETCNSIKRSLESAFNKEKGKFFCKLFGIFDKNII